MPLGMEAKLCYFVTQLLSPPRNKHSGTAAPTFRPMSIMPNGRTSEQLLSSCSYIHRENRTPVTNFDKYVRVSIIFGTETG